MGQDREWVQGLQGLRVAKLIFERAIHRDPDTGDYVSYWPERWPLELLADELVGQGVPFFSAAYMNDPAALTGNVLKVEWLHYYTDAQLEAAREAANVERGLVYIGADLSAGGKGQDPDYMGLMAVEVIANRGFLIAFYTGRHPVEKQADMIEIFADQHKPTLIVLEDTSSRGFAYVSFSSLINDGRGTRWPVVVRTPQGARDSGGKTRRLLAVSARFMASQIRVPGIFKDGDLIVHPEWQGFLQQWRSYPTGHDDILDANYWAAYEAFSDIVAAGTTKAPQQREIHEEAVETFFKNNTHLRNKLLAVNGGVMPPLKDILRHFNEGTLQQYLAELLESSRAATDARGRRLGTIGDSRERPRLRWRQ
jgi:hypothetical protein